MRRLMWRALYKLAFRVLGFDLRHAEVIREGYGCWYSDGYPGPDGDQSDRYADLMLAFAIALDEPSLYGHYGNEPLPAPKQSLADKVMRRLGLWSW